MTHTTSSSSNTCKIASSQTVNETLWHELYPFLYSLIRRQVYAFRVPSWYGQENDIIDDIVQEAMRRIIERLHRAEQGEEAPIHCLEHMIVVIACNYCRDLRRRDKRLVHFVADSHPFMEEVVNPINQPDTLDPSGEATEQAYQQALFTLLAQEIAQFPCKQRDALLVDLANHMSFEEQPTALQKAFLRIGIRLQDYQQVAAQDIKQRARQAALLHHAYKRVSQLTQVQCFAGVA